MNEIQRRRRIDPKTIISILAGLYAISPVDLIPDPIPVLGQADDALVILLAVMAICAMYAFGGDNND